MSGLLHDVGKIGIPESVLQKTGRLTALKKFDQMKKHPQIGARILAGHQAGRATSSPASSITTNATTARATPPASAGREISRSWAESSCLADCFDAMTSNRTYRKALPLEVALTEIRRCSGTQFDPRPHRGGLPPHRCIEKFRPALLAEPFQPPECARPLMDLQQQTLRDAPLTVNWRRPTGNYPMSIKCEEYSQVCVIEVQGDFLAGETAAAVQESSLEEHVDQRQIRRLRRGFSRKSAGFIDSDALLETLLLDEDADAKNSSAGLKLVTESRRKT